MLKNTPQLTNLTIPSLIGAGLHSVGLLGVPYFSLPWEYAADCYGGVNRGGYEAWVSDGASIFWYYTLIVAEMTGGIRMKSGKLSGSVIGAVIMESILFIEIAIDLYTGKMSWTDLSMILTICLLLAIPIVTIMRKKRKNRESFHSKQAKKYNKIDKSTQD